MPLTRVQIENFRSIKSLEIGLNPACKVLVGINECGKTNILHALELLDPKKSPKPGDVREPVKDEEPAAHAFVRFAFRLTPDEVEEFVSEVKTVLLAGSTDGPTFKVGGKTFSVKEFCQACEPIIQVDLRSKKRWFSVTDCDRTDFLYQGE